MICYTDTSASEQFSKSLQTRNIDVRHNSSSSKIKCSSETGRNDDNHKTDPIPSARARVSRRQRLVLVRYILPPDRTATTSEVCSNRRLLICI